MLAEKVLVKPVLVNRSQRITPAGRQVSILDGSTSASMGVLAENSVEAFVNFED
jgi:hypothetical protein